MRSMFFSVLIIQAYGQGINESGIPVDGDFVGPVIPLFIMPVGGFGMWTADEITGPGAIQVVAVVATIVRGHRWLETEAGDKRPAVIIAAEQVVQGIQAGVAINAFG